jgi:hypothetical protein
MQGGYDVRTLRSAMTADLRDRLEPAVRGVLATGPRLVDEADFQGRLVRSLGTCDTELQMTFDVPAHAPRRPPTGAIVECASKGKQLDPDGKDACSGSRRKLDILWHVGGQHVPIELKLVTKRKSDVYGYEFLKDMHRLERLRSVAGQAELTEARFAVFATCESLYWKNAPPEPEPFRLFDGRAIPARHWVQYNQYSARTLWFDYPPFYLANPYRFDWLDAAPFGRFLLVSVRRQQSGEHKPTGD